jgi:hypothetical protein
MREVRTLHDVKTALAEKYERLARETPSTPRRQHFLNRATRYRRQAAQLTHGTK